MTFEQRTTPHSVWIRDSQDAVAGGFDADEFYIFGRCRDGACVGYINQYIREGPLKLFDRLRRDNIPVVEAYKDVVRSFPEPFIDPRTAIPL